MPFAGSGERRVEATYRYFSDNEGYDFSVITKERGGEKYKGVIYVKQRFIQDREVFKQGFNKKKFNKIKIVSKSLLFWVPFVVLKLRSVKADFLIATVPDISNLIIAVLYKILVNRKSIVIVEYRDLYSLDPSVINNKERKLAFLLEKLLMKQCYKIVTTTVGMKSAIELVLNHGRLEVVRNYISKVDFVNAKSLPSLDLDTEYCNIGYIGALNTGRDPKEIFDFYNKQIDGKQTKIYIVGLSPIQKEDVIGYIHAHSYDLSRFVLVDRVARTEAYRYMKSLDAVILIIHPSAKISEGFGMPGKVYDYLALSQKVVCSKTTYNNLSSELDLDVDFVNGYCILKSSRMPYFEDVAHLLLQG